MTLYYDPQILNINLLQTCDYVHVCMIWKWPVISVPWWYCRVRVWRQSQDVVLLKKTRPLLSLVRKAVSNHANVTWTHD